jgi:hypothetical protein
MDITNLVLGVIGFFTQQGFWIQVLVVLSALMGVALGDTVASFFFGKVKGRFKQILYLVLFAIFIVLEGYVMQLFGINLMDMHPALACTVSGLFGSTVVFLNRAILHVLDEIQTSIKLSKTHKFGLNGKRLVKELRGKGLEKEEVRKVLLASAKSERRVDKVLSGKNEWLEINLNTLSYELSKRELSADDIINILHKMAGIHPEDAVEIWKRSSV